MWRNYKLEMEINRLVGGIPRHPEIIRRWQESKFPTPSKNVDNLTVEGVTEKTIKELGNQALSAEEELQGIWTGFAEKNGMLVIEERQIKAMLKESANIVKGLKEMMKKGRDGTEKAVYLRALVAERVFVSPHWIVVGDPALVQSMERTINVMTARGPRTALKRSDYFDDVTLECTLRVLDDGVITEKILRVILEHARFNGLGTDRSQGNGTFTYKLTEE